MPYKAGTHSKIDEELTKQVGCRIKELRTDAGLSQTELSFKAELHRNYIGDMERGESLPSLVTIKKLCNAFEIDYQQFFEGMSPLN